MMPSHGLDSHGSGSPSKPAQPAQPCIFRDCEEAVPQGIPFCVRHLFEINSAPRKQDAPLPPETAGSSVGSNVPQPNGDASTSSGIRNGRHSPTYIRRKSAPQGVARAPASRTSKEPVWTKPLRPTNANRAPPSPAPLNGGDDPYFSAMHPSSHHPAGSEALDKSNGKHSTHAILTPAESPPDLRSRTSSKHPRPEFQNDEQQRSRPESPMVIYASSGEETPNTPPPQSESNRTVFSITSATSATSISRDTSNDLESRGGAVKGPPEEQRDRGDDANRPAMSEERRALVFRRMQARRRDHRERERDRDQDRPVPASVVGLGPSLDAFIYSQDPDVAPLPPPQSVTVPSKAQLAAVMIGASTAYVTRPARPANAAYIYAHIDPRVHWTRSRSKAWHDAKQREIKARGGRKANVGKAVQRAVQQRRKQRRDEARSATSTARATAAAGGTNGARLLATSATFPPKPSVWTGELPPDVTRNRSWLSFMAMFVQDEDSRRQQGSKSASSHGRQKGSHA